MAQTHIQNWIQDLEKHNIHVSFDSQKTGGYPSRIDAHFQNVRFQKKGQWSVLVPHIFCETHFFFPLTRKISFRMLGTIQITDPQATGQITFRSFEGSIQGREPSVQLQGEQAIFSWKTFVFAEFPKIQAMIRQKKNESHLGLKGQFKIPMMDRLSSSLIGNFSLTGSLASIRSLQTPQQIGGKLKIQKLHLETDGLELEIQGHLRRLPSDPLSGQLVVEIQDISHALPWLKRFHPPQDWILDLLEKVVSLKKGKLAFHISITQGILTIQEFPFFPIPLIPEN